MAENSLATLKNDLTVLSEFYDKNAPAFYGQIMKIVEHKEIADRVLAKSFIDIIDNKIQPQQYLHPFTIVLNHCRNQSLRTIKAIKIFQAFNNGSLIINIPPSPGTMGSL